MTTFAPLLTLDPATATKGTGGTTPISFTVRLTPASGSAVSASWQVVNGTATLGQDIVLEDATGVVTFAPGETVKSIVIRTVGDSLPEPTETFTLRVVVRPARRGRRPARSSTTTWRPGLARRARTSS